MKSQKRDRTERAYKKGYQAGLYGRSKDSCPISNGAEKQDWISGWREGRQDNWDGMIGAASVNKVSRMY